MYLAPPMPGPQVAVPTVEKPVLRVQVLPTVTGTKVPPMLADAGDAMINDASTAATAIVAKEMARKDLRLRMCDGLMVALQYPAWNASGTPHGPEATEA